MIVEYDEIYLKLLAKWRKEWHLQLALQKINFVPKPDWTSLTTGTTMSS